jgi:surface carbohydrate biosynthesis protein (TIGR04326 family)
VTSLTIWADDDPPPANSGPVALWQAFLPDDAPEDWYAMPDEVHRNRESLRTDYLAWLHEAGVTKVRGVSLVDRMAIRQGLSYWWMTIPADNSIESNSPAYIAVRLMALAALADRLGVTSVRIVTSDRSLARLLRQWAKSTGRTYGAKLGPRPRLTRESIYGAFPLLAAIRVVIGHAGIPRRVKNLSEESPADAGQHGICLVDYMAHLAPGAVNEGRFASNYWGPLVQLLDELDEPVRWLHISADLASSGVVARDDELVRRFDAKATRQTHDLLHRHLTWAVLTRSCRDYLRVRWFGITAGPRARIFFDARSGSSLWQAVRTAYGDQFFGKTAMLNCLWLNILEESLGRMPKQRLGIYLFENQPWEMAFIHAWRKAGHGELLGVAHSTTRFWDIRYFKDPRDLWSEVGMHPMPWPDNVAVNGPFMHRICHQAGYPEVHVIELEALRYLHLLQQGLARAEDSPPRILIFGEYSPETEQRMLQLINLSLAHGEFAATMTFRPHPAVAHYSSPLHPSIQTLGIGTIEEALEGVNVVICGATSSVALEVAATGRQVLVIGDGRVFSSGDTTSGHAPMLVTSPALLARGVADALERSGLVHKVPQRDVMCLDQAIDKWRALANANS